MGLTYLCSPKSGVLAGNTRTAGTDAKHSSFPRLTTELGQPATPASAGTVSQRCPTVAPPGALGFFVVWHQGRRLSCQFRVLLTDVPGHKVQAAWPFMAQSWKPLPDSPGQQEKLQTHTSPWEDCPTIWRHVLRPPNPLPSSDFYKMDSHHERHYNIGAK